MAAQLTSEREHTAGGESSKGGADELKMGCLVSSSLQRKISIRVIRGSAAWHEGTQRILGMFCTVSTVRTAVQAPLLTFIYFYLFDDNVLI